MPSEMSARRSRRVAVLGTVLSLVVGLFAAPGVAALGPGIVLVPPSPVDGATLDSGDVRFAFSVDRPLRSITATACTLSSAVDVTTTDCDALVPVRLGGRAGAESGRSYAGLDDGAYTFTAVITFHGGASATATRNFTVDRPNRPPIANHDFLSTDEDVPLTGNVLSNDIDPDGDHLTVTRITDPSNGILILNADGSFTYTPNSLYYGADGFDYMVSDGAAVSVGFVIIEIRRVTDLPRIWQFFLISAGESTTTICESTDGLVGAYLLGSDLDGPWRLQIAREGVVLADSGLTTSLSLQVYTPTAALSAGEYTYTGLVSEGGDVTTRDITLTVLSIDDPVCAS